jgi:uncharacterized integral membrane protein
MSNEPTADSSGISFRAWIRIGVATLAAVLLLVFIVQNASTVEIDFVFGTVETRLVWALLLSAGLGLVIGLLVPRLRRREDE